MPRPRSESAASTSSSHSVPGVPAAGDGRHRQRPERDELALRHEDHARDREHEDQRKRQGSA